jgi:hypothetical protein
MKTKLRLNYNSAKLRVCVDSAKEGLIEGRVYSMRLRDVLLFPDLNSLVLSLDRLMDEQNYPQSFQRKRTFRPAAPAHSKDGSGDAPDEDDRPYMDGETVAAAFGEKATFVLQVLSRQNTNWQGHVDFLDGNGDRSFESELGFLALVNDFLTGA